MLVEPTSSSLHGPFPACAASRNRSRPGERTAPRQLTCRSCVLAGSPARGGAAPGGGMGGHQAFGLVCRRLPHPCDIGSARIPAAGGRPDPPGRLGADRPHPDCLVLHQFRGEDGEEFLGLMEVMTAHKIDEAVRLWENNTKLLLTIVRWESATSADSRLSHLQILDETPDFTHPRRLITHWLHAP